MTLRDEREAESARRIKALQQDAEHLARALQWAVAALRLGQTGAADHPYLARTFAHHAEVMRSI